MERERQRERMRQGCMTEKDGADEEENKIKNSLKP